MKALSSLPEKYSEYFSVDLQKNKKQMIFVNLLSFLIAVLMFIPMCFIVPFEIEITSEALIGLLIKLLAIFILLVVYIVLHELVHGIAMKICGAKKVKYGFTGLYAFAGSDDYYDKRSYIFIALAPVVLWGIVLAVVNIFVPRSWFWIIYFIQIQNISGAAGDFYVTVRFLRFPKNILVHDSGTSMKVYAETEK